MFRVTFGEHLTMMKFIFPKQLVFLFHQWKEKNYLGDYKVRVIFGKN